MRYGQIRERGVLRVGYNQNNVPFVFFNGRGELVGYDVEMAYDLARTLNVSRIEFVPITGTTLAESLDSGYCDIVMAAVVVNTDRLDQMKFTDPTVNVHLAFVVPDGKKDAFTQLDDVKKMDGLRVAVYNNTALVPVAKQLLPNATIVPIDTKEDFFVLKKADALLIPAEEGYTLTLEYPFFGVAIIQPYDAYLMMYAYPVAKDSSDSYLLALDYWIRMEKDYGHAPEKVRLLGARQDPGGGRAPLVRGAERAALDGLIFTHPIRVAFLSSEKRKRADCLPVGRYSPVPNVRQDFRT